MSKIKDLERCAKEISEIEALPPNRYSAMGWADWEIEKEFILREDMIEQLTSAKVILDSICRGYRLTTMEVVFHRYALAEFNTHRAFSRNSASSRAIPIEKIISRVIEKPATPRHWGKNQKGMQAEQELSQEDQQTALNIWLSARDAAIDHADRLRILGVHKQITNRLLEPFLWHTAIVSFTDFDNFERQRCSSLALPEFEALANAMRDALHASSPVEVTYNDWHTPYIQKDEMLLDSDIKKRISVARCARVSYLTHDGKRSIDDDLLMYHRLCNAEPPHMSPFEHVATPHDFGIATPSSEHYIGNFQGWVQLRHLLFGR